MAAKYGSGGRGVGWGGVGLGGGVEEERIEPQIEPQIERLFLVGGWSGKVKEGVNRQRQRQRS